MVQGPKEGYFPNLPKQRKHGKMFRNMSRNPQARLRILQGMVTALVRHERIETTYAKGHETQKYAEKLIEFAKRGYKDPKHMGIANDWLAENDLVHKLFKVLVPRYESRNGNYTKLWKVGERGMHLHPRASPMVFLEFVGNPFPPMQPPKKKNPGWLVNILLDGVKEEVKKTEALDLAKTIPWGIEYNYTGIIDQDVRIKNPTTLPKSEELRESQEIKVDTKDAKAKIISPENKGTPV
ncbi:large ribosomal subunit protein bL17m-like [Saccoglossus kowalevskii]|uniref:Large ribosomal subunit protein bL17m n=1 Tax=Saccoglossus kowalevskii TaxID=10224 RepID=A0ABM0GW83_SACKO|nr:PREDICTED: 39S ribosomal protein L17, mitochondrial-like [Saccoglossus kowalevskii]